MYELLTNPSCRDKMGRAARHSAEQFDWSIIAGRMVALYRKLLTEPHPSPL